MLAYLKLLKAVANCL